jgi:hypothetical protein
MITEDQAVAIASDTVRRERGWEPRLCRVTKIDRTKRPSPHTSDRIEWAVVFWYPDVDMSRPLDPCTYAVHVDVESGKACLVEE